MSTQLQPSTAPKLVPNHRTDRKSTRLNSSHGYISYAVFCLKKKNKLLVHNYGHGCAGITLSWGTASLAADLACEYLRPRTPSSALCPKRAQLRPRHFHDLS